MKPSGKNHFRITVGGDELTWSVRHWPAWDHARHGYLGLSLLVTLDGERTRPLILEFPFEDRPRVFNPPHRHRPEISDSALAAHIQRALDLGWRPASRGKPFVLDLDAEN